MREMSRETKFPLPNDTEQSDGAGRRDKCEMCRIARLLCITQHSTDHVWTRQMEVHFITLMTRSDGDTDTDSII